MAHATTTTGQSAQTTPTGRNALELSQTAAYALAKQVPDIARRGCIIGGAYGEITIMPGRLADRLAKFLAAEISKGGLQ